MAVWRFYAQCGVSGVCAGGLGVPIILSQVVDGCVSNECAEVSATVLCCVGGALRVRVRVLELLRLPMLRVKARKMASKKGYRCTKFSISQVLILYTYMIVLSGSRRGYFGLRFRFSTTYPKLDPDASAARYPSQASTIPNHTIQIIFCY